MWSESAQFLRSNFLWDPTSCPQLIMAYILTSGSVLYYTSKGSIRKHSHVARNQAVYIFDLRSQVVCVVCVLSSHLFWTSDLWTHQLGSHRRKAKQDFSTFLLRYLPYFLSREGFSRYFPSSTMKSNIVYPRLVAACRGIVSLIRITAFCTVAGVWSRVWLHPTI